MCYFHTVYLCKVPCILLLFCFLESQIIISFQSICAKPLYQSIYSFLALHSRKLFTLFKSLNNYKRAQRLKQVEKIEDKIRKISANVHVQESDGASVTGVSLSLSCKEGNNQVLDFIVCQLYCEHSMTMHKICCVNKQDSFSIYYLQLPLICILLRNHNRICKQRMNKTM